MFTTYPMAQKLSSALWSNNAQNAHHKKGKKHHRLFELNGFFFKTERIKKNNNKFWVNDCDSCPDHFIVFTLKPFMFYCMCACLSNIVKWRQVFVRSWLFSFFLFFFSASFLILILFFQCDVKTFNLILIKNVKCTFETCITLFSFVLRILTYAQCDIVHSTVKMTIWLLSELNLLEHFVKNH